MCSRELESACDALSILEDFAARYAIVMGSVVSFFHCGLSVHVTVRQGDSVLHCTMGRIAT